MDKKWRILIIFIAILVLLFAGSIIGLYTDWLWFDSLGFSILFSKILWTKIGLGLFSGLAFFFAIYGNIWLTRKLVPPMMGRQVPPGASNPFGNWTRTSLTLFGVLFSAVLAVFLGLSASSYYMDWLYWHNSVSFGQADPVLGIDLSFYIFKLPFAEFLFGKIVFVLVASLAASVILYASEDAVNYYGGSFNVDKRARAHLGTLAALLFFAVAYGCRMSMFHLLSTQGPQFDGPGYAEVHANLPGLWALLALAVINGVVFFVGVLKNQKRWLVSPVVAQIVAAFLLVSIYPSLLQQLVVRPNQQQKELPYIERHIKATRDAYGLNDIAVRQFPADTSLTAEQIANNASTIENTRLWDSEHVSGVYSVLQTIQQYYHFYNVDVDRYWIATPGQERHYRQVWLGARELSQDSLPLESQTWVNKRLRYTHGYGLVMSPINEVGGEGLPNYFISDIPPRTTTDLKLDKMGVYFGEMTDEYVFVKTSYDEFDYPTGDSTKITEYDADSGIPIGGFFRKLLFAVRFSDINILLNTNLKQESKLLYRRNISDRIQTLFPFLKQDFDPYLVLADGNLHWIVDAYTVSHKYPYSRKVWLDDEPINYIRNSVKITVDAYSGEVNAYIIEMPQKDPIVRAYEKIFPGVFHDISEMPDSLRAHIRYPESLFRTQNVIFETYHMSDPAVFYQRSDQWTIPNAARLEGGGTGSTMEPYYTIMRLPNAETEEFILMTVFKRKAKTNMVAWMCAKCDEQDYGKLVLYEFADDRNVVGPDQVIARTNQDTYISQQISLWNQGTSNVSSGNLLVMPIDTSLLYVMPLYLESSNTKIPELKMIIASLGDRLVMEPTLQIALTKLIGEDVKIARPAAQSARPTVQVPAEVGEGVVEAVDRAISAYKQAQEALKQGNWAEYGKQQAEVEKALTKLKAEVAK